jgi:hypothetical protein
MKKYGELRSKPSGHVHYWSYAKSPDWVKRFGKGEGPMAQSICGLKKFRVDLTADYPPLARHCHVCFPLDPEES